jgi:hypothetical protein
LIAIAASFLMQHVRAYRGCDDSASQSAIIDRAWSKHGGRNKRLTILDKAASHYASPFSTLALSRIAQDGTNVVAR